MMRDSIHTTAGRGIPVPRNVSSGHLLAALTLALGMLLGLWPLAAERLEKDGLKIEVNRAQAELPGYQAFEIIVENSTTTDRTLHAVIQLIRRAKTQPGDVAKPGETAPPAQTQSACIAYLEIPARHRLTETVVCKGEPFTAYNFEIQNVLPLILESSPLQWQKAIPLDPPVKTPPTDQSAAQPKS
jgi:hypothetical protein